MNQETVMRELRRALDQSPVTREPVSNQPKEKQELISDKKDSSALTDKEECQRIIKEINDHFGIDIIYAAQDIGIKSDNVHEIMTEVRTWTDPADVQKLLDAVKRRVNE